MPDGPIIVENREHLWHLLAEAAQLEHMIMCQYLFAEFSLKEGTDEGLTAEQLAVVDRWRATLREIAVQEMLHLALVCNMMSAIGAAPTLGRPNFPQHCDYFPAAIQLVLLPFDEAALTHFLFLERPEGMSRPDAENFVSTCPVPDTISRAELFPGPQEYATVGYLYRAIADGFATLVDRLGEEAVFVGSPRAQATPERLHWPELIAVTDLQSARAAADHIVEQGEGCSGDWREAHYGRLLAMWEEYRDLTARDPAFAPARPALPTYIRQPYDVSAAQPLLAGGLAGEVAELFHLGYEVLLQMLTRYFTHTDETEDQLGTLMGGAIGLMIDVIGPLGRALTRLPAGPDHPGRTAGPAFEMFYTMGNFVPAREAAWAVLAERIELLAARCAPLTGADPHTTAAAQHAVVRAAQIAERLTAHVPADLRPRRSRRKAPVQ